MRRVYSLYLSAWSLREKLGVMWRAGMKVSRRTYNSFTFFCRTDRSCESIRYCSNYYSVTAKDGARIDCFRLVGRRMKLNGC